MPPSGVTYTFQILDIHAYACGLENCTSLAGLHSALPLGQGLLNLPLPAGEDRGENTGTSKTKNRLFMCEN